MEGTPREARIYYRCAARSIVPGAAALDGHPKNVYLPEAAVLGPLNAWIGGLFNRKNLDRTVTALVMSQERGHQEPTARQAMKKRLGEAESRLRKLRTAIEAGVDPAHWLSQSTRRKLNAPPRALSWTLTPRRWTHCPTPRSTR
jgi:hypothetical protein